MYKKINSIAKPFPSNKYKLICPACERGGEYDLGLIVVDMEKFQSSGKNAKSHAIDVLQFGGYFRCKHCNAAGNWQFPDNTRTMLSFTVLNVTLNKVLGVKNDSVVLGKLATFDRKTFRWSSEAEEHYLGKLDKKPDDAWVWDRLGNMYYKGGRPDLAAVAFEESIKNDPKQTESHYSLGQLLYMAGMNDAAIQHLRQVLITARDYDKIGPSELRDMLTESLFTAPPLKNSIIQVPGKKKKASKKKRRKK